MSDVVVIGGGPTGLTAGMVLADQGLEVTVLEKDAAPVPESVPDAWESWERNGVSQFRQAHTLLARGTHELSESLPNVVKLLEEAGAYRWSPLDGMPPTISDREPREGDEELTSLGARRPLYELAVARAAETNGNLEVRRGVNVIELISGAPAMAGVPHVQGVKTSEGALIPATVVLDAGGRRSRLGPLLETLGAQTPQEEDEDSRFVYYTRYYRRRPVGDLPRPHIARLIPQGSISILMLPGDNDTWSVTLYATSADKVMRSVRDPETFDTVLRAHPMASHWADGDPITGVDVMAGVTDRTRSLRTNGSPVATGVLPMGDAWACTNPSLGRGLSMAVMHVNATLSDLPSKLDDPGAVFEIWDTNTEEHLAPWHQATLEMDRARNQQMDAHRLGRPIPPEQVAAEQAFMAAMMTDAEFFRAAVKMSGCLTLPGEVMTRPDLQEILASAPDFDDLPAAPPPPTRSELEDLLAG